MSLSLRLAALEVSPHALTLSLLHGDKMHEDCIGITGILPLNTESSITTEQRQYPWRQRKLTIQYSGMRGEEKETRGREGLGTAYYLGH